MNYKLDAYSLNVRYAENVIGELSLNKQTGLPKLEYNDDWQQNGFPISPNLTLDNNHDNAVAYNFLDNALPEGKARLLLAERARVSEKNVFSQEEQTYIDQLKNNIVSKAQHLNAQTSMISTIEV